MVCPLFLAAGKGAGCCLFTLQEVPVKIPAPKIKSFCTLQGPSDLPVTTSLSFPNQTQQIKARNERALRENPSGSGSSQKSGELFGSLEGFEDSSDPEQLPNKFAPQEVSAEGAELSQGQTQPEAISHSFCTSMKKGRAHINGNHVLPADLIGLAWMEPMALSQPG